MPSLFALLEEESDVCIMDRPDVELLWLPVIAVLCGEFHEAAPSSDAVVVTPVVTRDETDPTVGSWAVGVVFVADVSEVFAEPLFVDAGGRPKGPVEGMVVVVDLKGERVGIVDEKLLVSL